MAILKLDDLIKEEDVIELNGKTYHFNLSLKSMIKFQKWSQKNNSDDKFIEDSKATEELIELMIVEKDEFIKSIENLSTSNQMRILNSIITNWVNAMIPKEEQEELLGKDKKK